MRDKLDAAIDAHAEEAFAFLAALVGAPSTVGSEQAALKIFAAEAETLGLEVAKLPFPNEPMRDERAGISQPARLLSADRHQILATTPGDGELLVLLNGHMDVVPADAPRLWTTPPFEPDRREGRLYGRGAVDMKSGFAIGVLALRALRDSAPDLFDRRRLGFLAVIEEECTGNGVLRSIVDNGVTAKEVVLMEPTDLGLLIGGMGVLWIDIDVLGSSGHAHAADMHLSAIDLGMRLVERLRDWSEKLRQAEPEPTMGADAHPYNVNLGKLQAGDWTSSSPASASLGIRVGFPRTWTPSEAERKVRAVIADLAAEDPAFPAPPQVRLSGLRAKGYLQDEASPLVRDLAAAHADAHGAEPRVFTMGSTTDARTYVNDFDIPAVCYGATGGQLHGIDEYVELDSIVAAARTLSRFLLMRFGARENAA